MAAEPNELRVSMLLSELVQLIEKYEPHLPAGQIKSAFMMAIRFLK